MNEWIGKQVGWLIFVAILVSALNAIVRKVFNYSSNGYLELQWYLYGAAFMLAASWVIKTNDHVRIDLIYGRLSRNARNWIELLGHIFFLMPFVLVMIYFLWPYVIRSYNSGEMSANAGGLILWPAKLMLLIGFLQMFFQGLSEIIKRVGVMTGTYIDPNPYVTARDLAEQEAQQLAAEILKAQQAEQAK
ncbi:Tripartite ATP-independent periplasmic transporter DctQ component [Ketogulonicigenium robustum]|uniref:TRAP transporter small permease protein n=1 Tax=Ketogulonicigenium robustum TaxID=92947 RepID=A0A1W6NYI8_9RHOB|nr:Tripartite ATP-independent periplasmic transporter DctQ component [Ketogulonicigenium robustum]